MAMRMKYGAAQAAAISVILMLSGCNAASPTVAENRIVTGASWQSLASGYTRYADGRLSQVRVLPYFEFYETRSAEAGKRRPTLIIVAVEWDRYDAVIVDANSAFAQLPNNQMVGGDVETSQRISRSAQGFFGDARRLFIEQIAVLQPIRGSVPDRAVDRVSFDFITDMGTQTVQIDQRELAAGSSPFSALFVRARALRAEVERAGTATAG